MVAPFPASRRAWLLLAVALILPGAARARTLSLAAPERAAVDGMTVRFTADVAVPGSFVLLARQGAGGFVEVGELAALAGTHDFALEDRTPFEGFREYRLLYRDVSGREVVLIAAEARPGLRSSSTPGALPGPSTSMALAEEAPEPVVGGSPEGPGYIVSQLLDVEPQVATPPPERARRLS